MKKQFEKFVLLRRLHRLQTGRRSSKVAVKDLVHVPAQTALEGMTVKVNDLAATLDASALLCNSRGNLSTVHIGLRQCFSASSHDPKGDPKIRFYCLTALMQNFSQKSGQIYDNFRQNFSHKGGKYTT